MFPLTLFAFFFSDTATTEIYTLPYTTLFRSTCNECRTPARRAAAPRWPFRQAVWRPRHITDEWPQYRAVAEARSEEHTSELQSHSDLVCRLLLEKKNTTHTKRKQTHAQQKQT